MDGQCRTGADCSPARCLHSIVQLSGKLADAFLARCPRYHEIRFTGGVLIIARRLFVAAYDVHERKRRARVRRVVNEYASGGQKSAYECWLTAQECRKLHANVAGMLDLSKDSFALLPVQGEETFVGLGIASGPVDPEVTYVG